MEVVELLPLESSKHCFKGFLIPKWAALLSLPYAQNFFFLLLFFEFFYFLPFPLSFALCFDVPLSSWSFFLHTYSLRFVELAAILAEFSHYCSSCGRNLCWLTFEQ
jgi:hypothetical protein